MLTIAQRRTIAARASRDEAFRERLRANPRDAISDLIGVAISSDVELLEESPVRWAFVVPEGPIDPDLLEPTDPRSAIENDVYRVLRDEPEMIETAIRDPRGFLLERFGVSVRGVDLRRESAGRTIVVIPHEDSDEALDDAMLDLVAGGGEDPTKRIG